jgi:hypothetical protein
VAERRHLGIQTRKPQIHLHEKAASRPSIGGSFLAVVAAVTSFARRAAKPHAWTAPIAALTIAFGIGQCIGPVLTGALSDGSNGIRYGLCLSVASSLRPPSAACQPEPSANDE